MTGKKLRKKLLDASLGNLRGIDFFLSSLLPVRMPEPDTVTPIDIAIPIIPKDLPTLPLCIHAVRRNIPHRISEIYIIAPVTPEIEKAARDLNVTLIDETTVLPGAPKDIEISHPGRGDRKGWIFQQFVKLSGKIGSSPYILFIDSDHILLRPHTFLTKSGKSVLYTSKEFYLPYYDNIRRLTGKCRFARHSFVAHKMLFRKESLKKLRDMICPAGKWKERILDSLDWDYSSPFSEFELYTRTLDKEEYRTLPWHQKALSELPGNLSELDLEDTLTELARRYPHNLSVTFPAYLR